MLQKKVFDVFKFSPYPSAPKRGSLEEGRIFLNSNL
jgi:hypothetical protein